ncbi:MAG: TlpA family protein disulfide reductase, partial [Planctomycetota bacterium]
MIGIVQEQHPDRARLYKQWRQLNWPILVDSLNLLGLRAVPKLVALDESGVVRASGLRSMDALTAFL